MRRGEPLWTCLPAVAGVTWLYASGTEALTAGAAAVLVGFLLGIQWGVREVWGRRSIGLRERVVFAVAIGLIGTAVPTHWPLRITTALWRAPLERLADRAVRGEPVAVPVRVGPLLVRAVGDDRPPLRASLWLDRDPSGGTALVRCAPEYPNAWSVRLLGSGWALYTED